MSASESPQPTRRAPAAPLVLIVDDNADARDLVSEFLAHHGCAVFVAGDGVEALERAAAIAPDLIVMDMSMPRMDGAAATERLRADPRTARIPIIAVTGFGRPWEERARRAGCDVVLAKPLDVDVFRAHVLELLPALRAQRPSE